MGAVAHTCEAGREDQKLTVFLGYTATSRPVSKKLKIKMKQTNEKCAPSREESVDPRGDPTFWRPFSRLRFEVRLPDSRTPSLSSFICCHISAPLWPFEPGGDLERSEKEAQVQGGEQVGPAFKPRWDRAARQLTLCISS